MSSRLRQHLPNVITVLRLVLAAAFFAVLNQYRWPESSPTWGTVGIVLFVAAALTDAIDGALARRWQVVSTFGRIMDPFCDKVLVLGAFIYLAGPRFAILTPDGHVVGMATSVAPWMVVVILAREMLVTAIRGVVESSGVAFGAVWSGKLKMFLQSVTIPTVLGVAVHFRTGLDEPAFAARLCDVLVWTTMLVTIWSGLPYITRLRRLQMQKPNADA
ncbi:MAG: CDP-alcohol phosphatidyltransferase family protein [Phycisphaerales bacterium]|nr:CDP-alcohol phosphatidyltransferase family protein [Phycisphaerales bacterium]